MERRGGGEEGNDVKRGEGEERGVCLEMCGG